MRRPGVMLMVLACIAATPAYAVQPDEVMRDPVLEARARSLSEGLRCLVCQNQSIDDSAAPLARDLRLVVREHLKAGESDDQIRDFLVSRYGAFVLLKPPLTTATLLLWLAPVLVLAGAAAAIMGRRMGSRDATATAALSPGEEDRLDALLRDKPRA